MPAPLAIFHSNPGNCGSDPGMRLSGAANLFMFFAPLQNWRHVKVTERRIKVDWVMCMHDLVYVRSPQAERCVLVEDQLNTHDPASLYDVFEPAKARRILDRLKFHFTPKHGSWLNMSEIELSVLSRQCLDGYTLDPLTLAQEIAAWEIERNSMSQRWIGVSRGRGTHQAQETLSNHLPSRKC
jgi:hypothetical protein